MLGRGIYENSRAGGVGLLEVADKEGEEPQRLFVPLKRSELHGEVTGPLAAMRLVQVYGYSREQCDRVLEAVYRFPLPGDAAVTGVRVRFGEVEIATELKEREQAESEYQEAVEQGKQAALLTRETPTCSPSRWQASSLTRRCASRPVTCNWPARKAKRPPGRCACP